MISIIVPIDPIPQPRPKFGNGRAYQPKRTVAYKEFVSLAAKTAMSGRKIFDKNAVDIHICFYRKFSPTSRNYGDFDNLAKAICDALNGIVYRDDSQIVRCVIEKRQDKLNPRVEITACDVAGCSGS